MADTDVSFESLIIATDVDVLPASSSVERRGEYVVVRSPSNPTHFWGNFLIWDHPPRAGDRERWEAAFEAEFGAGDGSRHRAFTWNGAGSDLGDVEQEFLTAGYQGDADVGLVARPEELVAHPRANTEVRIHQLRLDGDEGLWDAAVELQVGNREEGHDEAFHREYVRRRMRDRRELFEQGRGGWFLALTPEGEPAASCGVIVTNGRARYQAVDTIEAFRRRGIASRLVHDAGRAAVEQYGATRLVIVAEAGYHALPLYESLGFRSRERGYGMCWWPGAPDAARHPRYGAGARIAD